MNGAVANVLNSVLGSWIENINSEQLKLSVFSGDLLLKNLRLKESAIESLGFPCKLITGEISSLSVKIPWTKLGSSPLQIQISGIHILLSPAGPETWSEKKELENVEVFKRTLIENYEAFSTTEIAVGEDKGFVAKLVNKIILNVQVKITSLYIRYEDKISGRTPFVAGIVVKSLKAVTCDNEWKPMFIEDAKMNFKIVKLSKLSLFLDYTEGLVKEFEPFDEVIHQEMTGELRHDYIISPTTFYLKVSLNTDPKDFSHPQYTMNLSIEKINLSVDMYQISHVLKFLEFLAEFDKFKQGIQQVLKQPDLSEEYLEEYRSIYRIYRLNIQNPKKSLKEKEKLQSIEKQFQVYSLLNHRKFVDSEMELIKKEQGLIEEIKKVEAESQEGTLSKLSGFLWKGKSDSQKKIDEENRKQKIESMKKLLDGIINEKSILAAEMKSLVANSTEFAVIPKDFVSYLFIVKIEKSKFSIKNNSEDLQVFKMSRFDLEFGLRLDTMYAKVGIKSTSIKDRIVKSKDFPYILQGDYLKLEYETLPSPKLELNSGGIVVIGNILSVFKTLDYFTEATKDFSEDLAKVYMKEVGDKTAEYINYGEQYMKDYLKTGIQGSLELILDIKAPLVCIPIDIYSISSGMLVVDFGNLQATTTSYVEDLFLFNKHSFKIQDCRVCTVWECGSYMAWREGQRSELLFPMNFSLELKMCTETQYEMPGIQGTLNYSPIKLTLQDEVYFFILKLNNAITSAMPQKPKEPQTKPKVASEQNVVETEALKDQLKKIDQIISLKFLMVFELIEVTINEKHKDLSVMYIENVKIVSSSSSKGDVLCNMIVSRFDIVDKREDVKLSKVVSNPTIEEIIADKFYDAEEEIVQVRLNLALVPKSDMLDVGVYLSDMRIIVDPSFLLDLMNFFSKPLEKVNRLSESSKSSLEERDIGAVCKYTTTFNTRVIMQLSNFEFWLPLTVRSQRRRTGCFFMGAFVEYRSIQTYTSSFDKYNNEVLREYNTITDEATVELTNIGGLVGLINKGRVVLSEERTYDLMPPTRIGFIYSCNKPQYEAVQTKFLLNLESIQFDIGFRDIQFFKALNENWAAVIEQGSSTTTELPDVKNSIILQVDCDAFKVTLSEDTGVKAYALLHFHLSSFKLTYSMDPDKFQGSFSTFLYSDYYNLKICAWEPMIENWNIYAQADQPNKESPIQYKITSPTMLDINITMSMIEIIGTLKLKLGEESIFWTENSAKETAMTDQNELLAHGQFFYMIENELGVMMQVYLDLPKTDVDTWALPPGGNQMFSYQQLQDKVNSSSCKKGLNNGITEEVQAPIALCIEIEGYSKVSGLFFERVGLKGFQLVSNERKLNCIMNVSSRDNLRVVRIESAKICINSTNCPLVLICGSYEKELEPGNAWPIPLKWMYSTEKPTILSKTGKIPLFENKAIELITGEWAVQTVSEYKTETKVRQTICHINPPFCFENLLPGLVTLYANKIEVPIGMLNSGSVLNVFKLSPNISHEFMLKLECESGLGFISDWTVYNSKKHSVHYKGNLSGKSIVVNSSLFEVKKCKNLDLSLRKKIIQQEADLITSKRFEMFSPFIIINKTDIELDIVDKKLGITSIPHSISFFKSSKIKLKVGKETFGESSELSKDFNIGAVGISGCISIPFKKMNEFTPKEILVGVSVVNASSPLIYTKLVYLVPRFLITNNLGFPIFLRQHFKDSEGGATVELQDNEILPYNLENSDLSRLIQVSKDGKKWSSAFSIQNIEDFELKFSCSEDEKSLKSSEWFRPSKFNNFSHIARVIVSTEDQATIHTIFANPQEPSFAINNSTSEKIRMKQKKFEEIIVPAHSRIPWAFDDLLGDKTLELNINGKTKEINIEKVKKSKKFSRYRFEIRVIGATRELIITLTRGSVDSEIAPEEPRTKFRLEIHFRGLGISIIDGKPSELFYFSAIEIDSLLKIQEEKDNKKIEVNQKFRLRVGKLQIDNMQAKGKLYPMIFGTSTKSTDENIPMIQIEIDKVRFQKMISIGKYEKDSIDRFSWVEIAIQEMKLNVNQEVIGSLLEFSTEIMNSLFLVSNSQVLPNKILPFIEICPGLDVSECKLSINPSTIKSKSFFKLLRLCAIKVLVSFKVSSKNLELNVDPREGFGLFQLLWAVCGAFGNFSDSPLYFKELLIQDSFQTTSVLMWQIISNYQRQGILQFYKILGSSDLIGNPVGLIDKLGTGVIEFINEPVKGVIKGPKAFAEGVSKGVRSLVGNIVAGSFGSISKITGNLYGLVKEVGGDPRNADRLNDSDNAFDNIYQGLKGGVLDLAEGVTGIFLKPWKGAKKEGAKGLIKGIGSGLLGIVTSPLSAALRIGSGISTGVTNAATFLARGKVTQAGRVRFPRHFSPRKVLEPYNLEVAEAQDYLSTLPEHHKEQIVFYMRIEEEESFIIIITLNEFLFIVNTDLIKKYDLEKISSLEVHMPSDNNFYLRIGCGNEDALVISSQNYSPLIKLYAAVSSLTNPAQPIKGVKKIKATNRYGNSCCRPKKIDRNISRYSLIKRK